MVLLLLVVDIYVTIMKNKFTSLELSKKLFENGCELYSDTIWTDGDLRISSFKKKNTIIELYTAYDILNDICVKYAKEFLGDKGLTSYESPSSSIISWIIYLLQKNKKQEAEDYIWENCNFNPKNK